MLMRLSALMNNEADFKMENVPLKKYPWPYKNYPDLLLNVYCYTSENLKYFLKRTAIQKCKIKNSSRCLKIQLWHVVVR